MPTPGGLPKVGEVWELTRKLPPKWEPIVTRFVVLERSGGEYWSMRVYVPGKGRQLWVDPAYNMQQNQLRYLHPAGNETRRKLNLPPMTRKQEIEHARYRTEQARKERP